MKGYIASAGGDEAEARSIIRMFGYGEPGDLVHAEPPHESGELETFVFTYEGDIDISGDMLHQHFSLPELPNLPFLEV